ncbi:MAG: hypothetical protein KDE34_17080 [Anaerolineales bacterium]|nr:hypothetical protein [Anaerolineales bacterium]
MRRRRQGESWAFMGRVLLKAAILFSLCNFLYLVTQPADFLGRFSLYNTVWAGRPRLPYGDQPEADYAVSLDNIPAMLASHEVTARPSDNEFRVFLLGDSSVWGWLLTNEQALADQLNVAGLVAPDGRTIRFYNLGYPIIALSKDLLLLDALMAEEPDLILWFTTLEAFPRDKQGVPPLVQNNPGRREALAEAYGLDFGDVPESGNFLTRTLIGERRALADLLRLQLYGASWQATGIDQALPVPYELRASDFDVDISWQGISEAAELPAGLLATDMIAAGYGLAGNTPIILINEPIFISNGANSDLHYNAFYPRWIYDEYRVFLAATAERNGWPYVDLWDAVPAEEFTDTPVHLTPAGTRQLADLILSYLEENLQ